jgi:ferrous iron transport protein A
MGKGGRWGLFGTLVGARGNGRGVDEFPGEKRRAPLSGAGSGQRALVVGFQGGAEFQGRIVSMGLNIGSEVEVLSGCDSGKGPILVAVGETRLALGHGMADKIIVEVDA